jgi:hypothetical protein
MKFENINVYNFENALRGMRNPLDSWHRADSLYGVGTYDECADAVAECIATWHPEAEDLD